MPTTATEMRNTQASFIGLPIDMTTVGVALVIDFDKNFRDSIAAHESEMKHLVRVTQVLGGAISIVSPPSEVQNQALEAISPRGAIDLQTFRHHVCEGELNNKTIAKTLGQIMYHQGIIDCRKLVFASTDKELVDAAQRGGYKHAVHFGSGKTVDADIKAVLATELNSVLIRLKEFYDNIPVSTQNAALRDDVKIFKGYLKDLVKDITSWRNRKKSIIRLVSEEKLEKKFSKIKNVIARDTAQLCRNWKQCFIPAEDTAGAVSADRIALPPVSGTTLANNEFQIFRSALNNAQRPPVVEATEQRDRQAEIPDRRKAAFTRKKKTVQWADKSIR